MDFETALQEFTKEMRAKFQLRDVKHGDDSVLKVGVVNADYRVIADKLVDEYHEWLAAPEETEEEAAETVDVANSAFLIWWWSQEHP